MASCDIDIIWFIWDGWIIVYIVGITEPAEPYKDPFWVESVTA